ncbi:MAG: GAF domain-containing SpoIIE family protein phosphatase [Cyclobacteriaceae bacterium]
MNSQALKRQLEIKELEINALLEITRAINNNLPEEALYKIFKFTAISNLKFSRLCLYVRDLSWSGKVHFGTAADYSGIQLPEALKIISLQTPVNQVLTAGPFMEFDLAIPITHKGEVISLVFIGGMEEVNKETFSDERLSFLQALCNIMIVAIENRKLARAELEQEAYRKEMEIASDVQPLLFPEKLPRSGKVIVEASYLPHDHVGGDYYDYIRLSDSKFLICTADVSGKGVGAALLMSSFQASLRTLIRQDLDLKEIVETLNARVLEITKGERFITCFVAVCDTVLRSLQYVNAGHNPPLLIFPDGQITLLEKGSTILGAVNKLPALQKGEVRLPDPATIFCYTDGLTETLDETGSEFGTEWLHSYFKANPAQDLNLLHQDIIIALDNFKGKNPYRDDITMLTCRIN